MNAGLMKLIQMAINSNHGLPVGKPMRLHFALYAKRQFSVEMQESLKFYNMQRRVRHIRLAKTACSDSQSRIAFTTTQSLPSTASETGPIVVHNNICVINKKDDTIKAKIIWAAKTANDNFSFRSSDGIGDTF